MQTLCCASMVQISKKKGGLVFIGVYLFYSFPFVYAFTLIYD